MLIMGYIAYALVGLMIIVPLIKWEYEDSKRFKNRRK